MTALILGLAGLSPPGLSPAAGQTLAPPTTAAGMTAAGTTTAPTLYALRVTGLVEGPRAGLVLLTAREALRRADLDGPAEVMTAAAARRAFMTDADGLLLAPSVPAVPEAHASAAVYRYEPVWIAVPTGDEGATDKRAGDEGRDTAAGTTSDGDSAPGLATRDHSRLGRLAGPLTRAIDRSMLPEAARLSDYDSLEALMSAARAGRVDAVLGDRVLMLRALAAADVAGTVPIERVHPAGEPVNLVIWVPDGEGAAERVAAINRALVQMTADGALATLRRHALP